MISRYAGKHYERNLQIIMQQINDGKNSYSSKHDQNHIGIFLDFFY